MRRVLAILLLPFVLVSVVGAVLLYPFGHDQRTGAEIGLNRVPVRGDVVAVAELACGGSDQGSDQGPGSGPRTCTTVTVHLTDGAAAGATVAVPVVSGSAAPSYSVGDHVVLAYSGGDPRSGESYELVDSQRGVPLVVLVVVFAGAVLLLGRWQGLASLTAMALSFAVLAVLVLPSILAGRDPLLVGLVGAGLIMFVVLYVTHGFSARTSTAALGTMASLALIAVLAYGFSAATRLTGLDEETTTLVGLLGQDIDTRGLLLASVVIGALGVLDDVTVTQTSAVWELHRANPALGWRGLFAAGQRIGRDHIASVVNTLVMAYTGTALPLLLVLSLSGRDLTDLLTTQQIAQEIVRALVGSIGLIAAAPLTTALAAFVASRQTSDAAEPTASGDHPVADAEVTQPLS